jgi:RIO kinase 2
VSSAERAATFITKLDPKELRILQSIELGMSKYEFVPLETIVKYTDLPYPEVEFWLKELDKKAMLWRQAEAYNGFILNYNSYDLLALNALVKGGIIDALGMPLGMGKEADVLEALTPAGEGVAVKFHRLGRVSFRDTRRKREYIASGRHGVSWLYQSRLAAEREHQALTLAYNAGVSVPKPIYQNRHTVVMQRLEGRQLSDVYEIDEPDALLDEIIVDVHKAYKAGVIHADLSEFNIVISEDARAYIIDWPQYIPLSHPNAEETLERDVKNVLIYFKRKFGTDRKLEDVLEAVRL